MSTKNRRIGNSRNQWVTSAVEPEHTCQHQPDGSRRLPLDRISQLSARKLSRMRKKLTPLEAVSDWTTAMDTVSVMSVRVLEYPFLLQAVRAVFVCFLYYFSIICKVA